MEELLGMFEEKKEPIDYRRGGAITVFVGIGIHCFGMTALGSFVERAGLLGGTVGVGL